MTPKFTPFEEIWTKEFLTRVLTALKTNTVEYLLCHASDEFRLIWNQHQRSIRELASKFSHPDAEHHPHAIVLFRPRPRYTKPYFDIMRDARLSFLQHEINRLTKPKQTSVQ